ncbi:serine/threonine-protein phosphatase [Nocardioides mangrovicus]|uniref:Serine/threonine-protein phosphatase n=1 Tax=Nocardioides mangrovicus TaxID=2478913 RepID=A0A3L8P4J6_9ACTN|nr:PP2C family protein-serine/threonine phosphatase [Nocardioides mangrovicus]RLV50002.1 serine/threonine-protein phosphatase [Nocardioides mangrovicus]
MRTSLRHFVADPVGSWRSGSRDSQAYTLCLLLGGVVGSFIVSMTSYDLMPLTAYFVWLLLGMVLLRFRPLLALVAVTAVAGLTAALSHPPIIAARVSALVVMAMCMAVILFQSSRQRSGLPSAISEGMLADLRDRLQRQGAVPTLPTGWQSQSAMIAAHGVGYGGDFLVARRSDSRTRLEMILVDVCGKGVGAATTALQFAGALDGLLGALPPQQLMRAANDFLLRQDSDEAFATAVHVAVDLETGAYEIISAGHPPVLVWSDPDEVWNLDATRGTALGIVAEPLLESTTGTLRPGEALLFYTDGVVESRDADLDDGIAWLQTTARDAISRGFDGAPRRIIRKVAAGDDDRAVLMLWREGVGVAVPVAPGFTGRPAKPGDIAD